MNWYQLLSTMRHQGWTVTASGTWVDVETPTGGQGGFERSGIGLKEALRFYRHYSSSDVEEATAGYSRRVAGRSPSMSWFIIGFSAFILISAIYSGVISPPNRLFFGGLALMSIVVIECTRRIARLW